jgi:DNA-binding NarL/FixJ family response regulator
MNILLVDDHPLIRDGIAGMLARLAPGSTLRQAADCAGGLALAKDWDPRLVLLDLGLPDASGLEALKAFKDACGTVPVVVLSGNGDPELVMQALDLGASGFIPKNMTPEEIWSALGVVLSGGIFLPSNVGGRAADIPVSGRSAGHEGGPSALDRIALTPRQREILRALAEGLSNKQIAVRFQLAEPTVKAHVSSVMRALNVGTRTHVLLWLSRNGIRLDTL